MKFAKGLAFTSMFGSLLATELIPFMANAQNPNSASGNVNQQVSPQAAQAANDYWSNERMHKAIPVDTSYGYSNQANAMYSPYFGREFLDLRTFSINKGA